MIEKRVLILQNEGECSFFEWIDGPEMWNSQILFFHMIEVSHFIPHFH
jgi:hypothetical protein